MVHAAPGLKRLPILGLRNVFKSHALKTIAFNHIFQSLLKEAHYACYNFKESSTIWPSFYFLLQALFGKTTIAISQTIYKAGKLSQSITTMPIPKDAVLQILASLRKGIVTSPIRQFCYFLTYHLYYRHLNHSLNSACLMLLCQL